MKMPLFEYEAPGSLAEALVLLAASDGGAKVIAGGQSLMPMLAFRLAAPDKLIDLRRVEGLSGIEVGEQGIRLGAKVRWCDIEGSRDLKIAHPLLVAAVSHVAHYQIRNRGTVGGSLANADPASELPGIAVTCEAELHLASVSGSRVLPAADFFLGPLTTALADDELITELRFSPGRTGRRWAFEEFARRKGDFAIAGIALFYDVTVSGIVENAHFGVIGACNAPHRLRNAEAALNGRGMSPAAVREVAKAAAAEVDPPKDVHASCGYRRALVELLVERALLRAAEATDR